MAPPLKRRRLLHPSYYDSDSESCGDDDDSTHGNVFLEKAVESGQVGLAAFQEIEHPKTNDTGNHGKSVVVEKHVKSGQAGVITSQGIKNFKVDVRGEQDDEPSFRPSSDGSCSMSISSGDSPVRRPPAPSISPISMQPVSAPAQTRQPVEVTQPPPIPTIVVEDFDSPAVTAQEAHHNTASGDFSRELANAANLASLSGESFSVEPDGDDDSGPDLDGLNDDEHLARYHLASQFIVPQRVFDDAQQPENRESTATTTVPNVEGLDQAGLDLPEFDAMDLDDPEPYEHETVREYRERVNRLHRDEVQRQQAQSDSFELFQPAFDGAVGTLFKFAYRAINDIPLDTDPPTSSPGEEHEYWLLYENWALALPDLDPLTPTSPTAKKGPEENAIDIASFRVEMANLFKKMMYVSGETAEPSVETTSIIEDIVRQQVIELLRTCTELAGRRGSRSISINDVIFQIRHDTAKVSRLRTFLSWKDVRKNVKDSDDKGGDADLGAAGEDPVGNVVAGGGPVEDAAKKNKKAKVGLPWEPSSYYSQEVPERDDEEDEEEEEMNYITLQRLRKADERTKAMTREEYVTWSEYRQASFTYRKGKRFREWAGFGIVTDSKPSDDIVDILGFLTFEMVQTLTENALKVKEQEDLVNKANSGGGGSTDAESGSAGKKRKLQQGLFDPPSEGKTPIEPRHVQEAFRQLQHRPKKMRSMLNGSQLPQHTPLNIF